MPSQAEIDLSVWNQTSNVFIKNDHHDNHYQYNLYGELSKNICTINQYRLIVKNLTYRPGIVQPGRNVSGQGQGVQGVVGYAKIRPAHFLLTITSIYLFLFSTSSSPPHFYWNRIMRYIERQARLWSLHRIQPNGPQTILHPATP